jgi:hypothetical protein
LVGLGLQLAAFAREDGSNWVTWIWWDMQPGRWGKPGFGKVQFAIKRQLKLYVDALRATGLVGDRRVRTGLLFTGSGQLLSS